MGQYYLVVNLDKRQYLDPHRLGDGLKLLEFGSSPDGTMCGLALLLADGNGRGGGDLDSENQIIGSWAGDRIVIAGDYADEGTYGVEGLCPGGEACCKSSHEKYCVPKGSKRNLYEACRAGHPWRDISKDVRTVMAEDRWLRQELRQSWGSEDAGDPLMQARAGDPAPEGEGAPAMGALRPDMVISFPKAG